MRLVGVGHGVLAAAVALGGGLAAAGETRAADLTAAATIAQVADVVRNVVGEHGEVIGLLGEGVDPHLYRLTRSDIDTLFSSDIIFYNGLLLEGKMTDSLIRLATAGKPVVPVTEALGEEILLEPEMFEGHYDPHVWMDPGAWSLTVDLVVDELSERFPEGAATFAANAEAYTSRLEQLDRYARSVLETVPEDARVLVTAHDAFNYFGRAYDFEVMGIQGISTESEAGLRRIEELVDLLVERGVGAVFVETSVADRNVRALIEGAAARGHEVAIGGQLFSDAMGAPGTYEGTYIGMIDHNVTTIARALGGDAPAGGMQGRLAAVAN